MATKSSAFTNVISGISVELLQIEKERDSEGEKI